ncbi:hypothetical protein [Corynebacterium aquatimens]
MSLPYFLTPDPLAGVLTGPEAAHAHVKRIEPGSTSCLPTARG